MLLQVVSSDEFTLGSKVISALLTVIMSLIVYIWTRHEKQTEEKHKQAEERHKEQKAQAEQRHKDQMAIIHKMDDRQGKIEEKQYAQQSQIIALNAVINAVQGKPFGYDNTKN